MPPGDCRVTVDQLPGLRRRLTLEGETSSCCGGDCFCSASTWSAAALASTASAVA